jgi:SpoIIAA-like
MLKLIEDLPKGIVGVEAAGEVTADDYRHVLVPAFDAAKAAAADGKVSVLYVIGADFPDYSAGALWQDTELGVGHLRSWRRIAVVSDAQWLSQAVHALGWLVPGEARVFPTAQLQDARAWVSG